MSKSKIEWTDKTWNPVTGCTKVSEGCKNCYAEGIANRFWGDRKFTDVHHHWDRLKQPKHWRKPSKIFVCSMSDLFHEDIAEDFLREVLLTIRDCPQHTFIVLTKRINRAKYLIDNGQIFLNYPNLWLGVSAENQAMADERIPILLQIPAAVRFVSCEPLLGEIDLMYPKTIYPDGAPRCCNGHECGCMGLPTEPPIIHGIDWVIAGCESGAGRRTSEFDWFANLLDSCTGTNTPFFLKQMEVCGKIIKMPDLLDGKVWDQMPCP